MDSQEIHYFEHDFINVIVEFVNSLVVKVENTLS